MAVLVMCQRDSGSSKFSTITFKEPTWSDSSCQGNRGEGCANRSQRLSEKLVRVQKPTWERKRSTEGLSGDLVGFPSGFWVTCGLRGSCRSIRTRVSPTHSAKYLLEDEQPHGQLICVNSAYLMNGDKYD